MRRRGPSRLGAALLAWLATTPAALAGKEAAPGPGPAASAAEIPALADLLAKAGWDPTPELSGVFKPGSVFLADGATHTLMIRSCFQGEPVTDTYTSTEVVSQLQAGVRVRVGLFSASGSGDLVKKVKFGAPAHTTLERLAMRPSPACRDLLAEAPADELDRMYAVQEVLSAEIAEQTCGRIDASGRFVGVGAVEGEYASACTQVSLDPVAVAYRVVPLRELLPRSEGGGWIPAPPSDCPWGTIRSFSASLGSMAINGELVDVTGREERAAVADGLQRCGMPEAARSFDRWRASRRTTNIACATLVGCYPFGIGILAGLRAGHHRRELEELVLSGAAESAPR